jgi:nucleotide-binding universal stress UspA family protein
MQGISMFRSILVGLDGTAFSDSAVSLGMRWAKAADAVLVGQGVVDLPGITSPQPVPMGATYFNGPADEEKLAEARRRVAEIVRKFSTRCQEADVRGEGRQDEGEPAEVIQREAQRCDMILLGLETHFRFATQTAACDTLEKVLHSPPRPVVAVPDQLGEGKVVVVGYDGSLQAARTLAAYVATGLHNRFETAVVTIDEDYEEAVRTAALAVDYLTRHGAIVKSRPVETRLDPGPILLDHTIQLDAHLLIMGAFGHSPLREFFFGSTTRTVLRGSKVPVMLSH